MIDRRTHEAANLSIGVFSESYEGSRRLSPNLVSQRSQDTMLAEGKRKNGF